MYNWEEAEMAEEDRKHFLTVQLDGQLAAQLTAAARRWNIEWESEGRIGSKSAIVRYVLRAYLNGNLFDLNSRLRRQVQTFLTVQADKTTSHTVSDVVDEAVREWLETRGVLL